MKKNPIKQLQASKLSIADIFNDLLNERKGFKYHIALREHRKLGFVTLNGNLLVSGWVGLAYDR